MVATFDLRTGLRCAKARAQTGSRLSRIGGVYRESSCALTVVVQWGIGTKWETRSVRADRVTRPLFPPSELLYGLNFRHR